MNTEDIHESSSFEGQLIGDVGWLATSAGERHDGAELPWRRLNTAADRIDDRLTAARFATWRERIRSAHARPVDNVIGERRGLGRPREIVVVGAHYDSVRGGPGAHDNASGVAALLAIARRLATTERTIRLVAFANEEPPHTRQRTMGSLVHARGCRDRGERIVAMLSLECLGFGRQDPRLVQRLLASAWRSPRAFVVGNMSSRALATAVAAALSEACELPVRRAIAPGFLPLVKSSDHWSFWKSGYPAVMVTDAAPLLYRHYHGSTDEPSRIDPESLAAVASALVAAVERLANPALGGPGQDASTSAP